MRITIFWLGILFISSVSTLKASEAAKDAQTYRCFFEYTNDQGKRMSDNFQYDPAQMFKRSYTIREKKYEVTVNTMVNETQMYIMLVTPKGPYTIGFTGIPAGTKFMKLMQRDTNLNPYFYLVCQAG